MICSAFILLPQFSTALHASTGEDGSLVNLDQCCPEAERIQGDPIIAHARRERHFLLLLAIIMPAPARIIAPLMIGEMVSLCWVLTPMDKTPIETPSRSV